MGKNWLLLIFCFFIFTPLFVNGQNFNEFLRIPIPGRVEGRGTHFEIKDSNYLNITLESEKEIEVVLESIPRMVSLNIASSTEPTTTLTIKGLEPNKKYFKYQDTHKNETEFFTDENGSYSWQQDLTTPHHIWIQEIKGTIYIPEDCTSTIGIWNEENRICTLTRDVTTSIEITTSSITLDCARYSITGQGADHGIYLQNQREVTIKNCVVTKFSWGIYLLSSLNSTITNNTVNNNYYGIDLRLDYSSDNTIISNTANNNVYGISLEVSSNNTIISNTANNNYFGIYLISSSNNIMRNNTMNNNTYNFYIYGWKISHFYQDIDTSNKVDEKPIYYWTNEKNAPNNCKNAEINESSNAGFVALVSCDNITVKNLNLTKNRHGILLVNTTNSKILNNTANNNEEGIFLYRSSNNAITSNIANNNGLVGIRLDYSSNTTIENNKILNNQIGIYSQESRLTMNRNVACGNRFWDFYSPNWLSSSGDNNVCDKPDGWKDTGTTTGCKYSCSAMPIPIIEFFPKSPVKGTKVKFDGTKSFDFDGEIVSFEWQIASTTFYGTTTEFTFDENGEYQVTLTVTDNDGATSSTSTTIKVEPFSFAIITDLHIGRGYSDYGSEGFDDEDKGEEYYLTQRLRNVVSWINEHKENYSLKFLAVLGDIADTAEKSEFCKAKEILDELEIPYVPVFGNHDVWPYTEKVSASTTLGEDFFERIFWSTSSIPCENASSTRNFETLLREFNFERDAQNPKFKNFTFNFGGIHFIGLDFNSREKACEKECGVKGEGILHNETISWLSEKLNELGGKETVIILSHEPFAKPFSRGFYKDSVLQNIIPFPQGNFSGEELEGINQILQNYENTSEGQQILGNFGGHIHGFEKLGKELRFLGQFSPIDLYFDANWQYPSLSTVPVLTTEALMVGGNEKNLENKGLIRIAKIEEKEKIDFSEIAFKEPALNPYITFEFKSKIVGNFIYPCLIFVPQTFSKREIDYYLWNFGDGKTERTSPLIWEGKTIHCYSPSILPATYDVTLIAVDKETNKSEFITKKIEIKEGIIPKIIKIGENLKEKIEMISLELNEKVTELGRTMQDWVWVKVKHSPATPVGLISIHFENALEDIDLSQLKVDVDFQKKKSLLYMSQWPLEIERSKILFVPK